ncbi:MAG: NADH-quinone oxidoreductase subunit A [Elusimicrobia bacterium]|nr:NADH-quinone oxidoreductase subunit A [Elusimicrobiota bacterium]
MTGFGAVFALFVLALLFAAGALVTAWLLRPALGYERKLSVYECGMPTVGTTQVKLNIRFYVFALLFLVFDVETLYVFPWAVVCRELQQEAGLLPLAEMAVFLSILFLGLVYAWRKGALEWE